ncbi:hypothetical protein RFI_14343, partial [Reticulomyxa filosa]
NERSRDQQNVHPEKKKLSLNRSLGFPTHKYILASLRKEFSPPIVCFLKKKKKKRVKLVSIEQLLQCFELNDKQKDNITPYCCELVRQSGCCICIRESNGILTTIVTKRVKHWSVNEVKDWLNVCVEGRFRKFGVIFAQQQIDGSQLIMMNKTALQNQIRMDNAQDRTVLMHEIRLLREHIEGECLKVDANISVRKLPAHRSQQEIEAQRERRKLH